MQVYIVTGGLKNCNYVPGQENSEASTEILLKEGGTGWKEVKNLPVVGRSRELNGGRLGVRGLGYKGKFIITGECVYIFVCEAYL